MTFLQLLLTGLANGLIIALVALGYTMVYGIVELINFAHGDVMMLGCFCALTILALTGLHGHPELALPLMLVSVPMFCAGLNWLVDRLAYRPLREAPKLTVLVSAIGVSFILQNIGLFWGGLPVKDFGGGASASSPKDFPDLLGNKNLLWAGCPIHIGPKELMVVAVTLPLMVALTWFVKRTPLGLQMRACAQNPVAARLMGIDVDRVISWTFVIGGAMAGVAAVVRSAYIGSIGYQVGYRAGMDAFTAAVLGGIGNLPGAVVGSLVIGIVRAMMEGMVDGGSQWSNATVFLVLILCLVFRPNGLLGAQVREKV
jgi:branched-chain amino acid transport system permease protein